NLYLVCTLLSTLWTIGDFITVYLVSGGAPFYSTDVLATLGFHYAFDAAQPALGVAAVMSALPVLIPITIILMRTLQTREVQLWRAACPCVRSARTYADAVAPAVPALSAGRCSGRGHGCGGRSRAGGWWQ